MTAFHSTPISALIRPFRAVAVWQRAWWTPVVFTWMLLGLMAHSSLQADDLSPRDEFVARLSASMDSLVDGKPYRDAILGIAKQAQVNVWLDRSVDPSAEVKVGSAGPTVYTAIEKIAAQRDCVLMPVANVLLIGREAWIDQTAATLLSLKLELNRQNSIDDVSWQALSTPIETLQVASTSANVSVNPPLPHDLWPATDWKQIDRRAAVSLILAQFNQRPQSTTSLESIRTDPASADGKFTRRYDLDKSCMAVLRSTFTRVDQKGQVEAADGWLVATGSVRAHRLAFSAAMNTLAETAKPVMADKATFQVKLSEVAGKALQQLAAKLEMKCVIDSTAQDACQQAVTISGEYTLKSLIEAVAEQAGVSATWKETEILFSKP
jgi:hypothetical protein